MAIKHHTIPPLGTVDAIDQPQWAEAHDIDSGGLTFSDSSVQTTAAAGGNPASKVGLAAVNGSAATFMRSDGAPALDQSITPTWTGQHTFTPGPAETAIIVNTTANNVGVSVQSGSGSGAIVEVCGDGSGTGNGLSITQTSVGAGVINLNFNAALSFKVNGTTRLTINADGGLVVGGATGGDEGAGTINATGLFVNGVAVTTGAHPTGANPTASVGLAAVNGSAATFMRSDGAPALDQTITPTWTGAHSFTPSGAVQAVVINAASGQFGAFVNGNSASTHSFGLGIAAGTTSADVALLVENQAGSATFLEIFGDGHGTLGPNSTHALSWNTNGAWTFGAASTGSTLTVNGSTANGFAAAQIISGGTASNSFGLAVQGGSNSSDYVLAVFNQAGTGTPHFQIRGDGANQIAPDGSTVSFYGVTPVSQRATTSVQRTTNVSTVTGTISVSSAAINSIANSLKEVMNTLKAYGLWSIS